MCNYSYAMLPRETRRLMRRRQQLMTKFSAVLANEPPETVRELQWTLKGLFTRWVELTQTCKVRNQVVKRFMDLQRCRLLSRAFHAMKHSIRVKYTYVATAATTGDDDAAAAVVASRTAIARQRRVENAAARRQVARSVAFDERRALFELNKWKLLVLHHEMHLHSNWHRRKNKFVAVQLRRHTMKDVTLKKRLNKFSQQVRPAAVQSLRRAGGGCGCCCGGAVASSSCSRFDALNCVRRWRTSRVGLEGRCASDCAWSGACCSPASSIGPSRGSRTRCTGQAAGTRRSRSRSRTRHAATCTSSVSSCTRRGR